MIIRRKSTTIVVLAAAFSISQSASADTSHADCQVIEKGKQKYEKSGACTYSQQQGNVTIRLRDGEVFSLRPKQKKANKYKDQKDRDVGRTFDGDNHIYNWKHRHITVSFDRSRHSNQNAPQIIMGRNGEGEVIFDHNNCVVYYNSRGERTRKNSNCKKGQGNKADDAMARHRREQGMTSSQYNEAHGDPEAGFAAWQAEQGGKGDVPEIVMGRNGEGEVIFHRNNCVVYYNSNGRRTKKNSNCQKGQGNTADDAMMRYRREQGY